MRTKHILSAFMLGALAVACTNEEFETMGNAPELSNRVEIGNVTLALGGDEANTRFEVGPNFNDLTAAVGDEVGACLIDAPNAVFGADNYKKDAKYGYDITSYISTNYSFKFNGNAWNSEAKMVEGNYMFYAPYNPKHATRASITAQLNPVQQLAKNADGTIDALSTIKELKESGEVMAVSHVFINAADSKTVTTSLMPIYAYPLVSLKNSYKETPQGATTAVATDLVINQVVISKTGGFPTEATFKFADDAKTAISAGAGLVKGLANFSYVDVADDDKVKTKKGLFVEKNGSKDIYTADLLNSASKTAAAIVIKAPESAYTLKAGATTQFHVVIPAADYSSNELTIAVYTNKGVFEVNNIDGSIAAGKRYPKSEYNADGTVIAQGEAGDAAAGDTYTFDMTTANGSSASVVASTADLATLIANTDAATTTTLTVAPLNTDVQVNAAVMSAIKAKSNTNFTVKFTAPVTIATSVSTNKKVEFAAGAEITEGTITLGGGADFITGEMLNVKGGTVTIDGATFTAATIENNGGALTVKSNITSLENKSGSVSVPNVVTGTFTNNGGTLTIGDGEKISDAAKTFSNTIANTKGTLEVKANTVATISSNGEKGIINNNGNATVTENVANGTINNYGILSVGSNAGLVVMAKATAKVAVTADTGGAGRIKNNVDATTIDISNASSQVIYYEFTEDVNGMLVPQAGIYNTIVLNGMTWSPSADQNLKVTVEMQDATISVYTPNIEITIDDMHIVKTSASNSASTMKGNATAKINVFNAAISGDTGAKLVVSNVAVKENTTSAGGSAVDTKTF